ncbi:MAG: hypothetical protein IE927_08605 [Rhodobacterales bacterium]|nr:hypothetical protein [Rhodobacterales bacterium]
MPELVSVTLRRLALPLVRPYRLSYRVFEVCEPFLVEVRDDQGRTGLADAHISPGSSAETRDGGWAFLDRHIRAALGQDPPAVKDAVLAEFAASKVAATALVTAIEDMERDPLLDLPQAVRLPLLTPVNQTEEAAIRAEIEDWLAQGFRTFKVKVGKDVQADLRRVGWIQSAVAGRATLRLDANRAFDRDQGVRFAAGLDPAGIELLEQPCDADDRDANAAVAAACPVPLMLDEPICTLDDIARAATIPNVGYCKLKLKRFGGLSRLAQGLQAVQDAGMQAVLGDGLGSELHNWMEACLASRFIRNAGEFNGFLKTRDRLFANPMTFADGAIHLPAGYRPQPDPQRIDRATAERQDYAL